MSSFEILLTNWLFVNRRPVVPTDDCLIAGMEKEAQRLDGQASALRRQIASLKSSARPRA